VVRRILRGTWEFRGERWDGVSQVAIDFISSLLTLEPEERPSAEQALQLTWLKRNNTNAPISYLLMDNVSASIRTFATYGKLKKLALLVVAYKSTDEELGFLRKIFDQFDSTNNGEISTEEFKKALTVYQYSNEELESMFVALDIDCTGKVHYSEFLAGALEAHGSIDEARIAEAFDRLDSDDSGFITVENLAEFIGHDISKGYIDSIIDEVDGNDDHKIGYQEFLDLWNETSTSKLKNALVDVYKRRETFESSEDFDLDISRSSSYNSRDEISLSGFPSANDHPEGKGGYFFAMEKQKSMRGVWL
jgi:calcium-dependent protein kinase